MPSINENKNTNERVKRKIAITRIAGNVPAKRELFSFSPSRDEDCI